MFVHHRKQEVVSTVEEKTAEEENFPELKDIDMIMTDETLRTLKVNPWCCLLKMHMYIYIDSESASIRK